MKRKRVEQLTPGFNKTRVVDIANVSTSSSSTSRPHETGASEGDDDWDNFENEGMQANTEEAWSQL